MTNLEKDLMFAMLEQEAENKRLKHEIESLKNSLEDARASKEIQEANAKRAASIKIGA